MTFSEETLHFETEDDAWAFLEELVDDRILLDSVPKLTFGEWAKIDVYVADEKYDAAITPSMMSGWLELQKSIYRSYALLQAGVSDARYLTDSDKERLELVVEVKSGSSDQQVDVQSILEAFVTAMVDKMPPEYILTVALVAVLAWGGKSAFQIWVNARKEAKLKELDVDIHRATAQAQRDALQAVVAVSGQERARAEVLSRAESLVPEAGAVASETDKGMEGLVKYMSKNDAIVNDVKVSASVGKALIARPRADTEDVRLDGIYRIRKVDTTISTGFRVHLLRNDGSELVADVAEVMTTLEDRSIIQAAEWDRIPVFLQINAKQRRGEYLDAIIVRARAYDPDTDEEWNE